LGAGETLIAKNAFASILRSFGFSLSSYHGDNDVFASKVFKDDCHIKEHQITFSGSGAYHPKLNFRMPHSNSC